MTKRYSTVRELQNDNNVDEIFYDKDLDDTPYNIMKKYEDDKKKMLPELFLPFLAENLKEKHDCPPDLADDLAASLIRGKKIIQDGEYAILEIKPRLPKGTDESKLSEEEKSAIEMEGDVYKKTFYYRRLKNTWVEDKEINEDAFIDSNTLFCNISESCLSNSKTDTCESLLDTSERLKAITKQKMITEFDKRYTIDIEELEHMLENDIAYYTKMLTKSANLNEIQSNKANYLAFELGKLSIKNEGIVSPHLTLRDLILSQDDFTKKQNDILLFTNKFCREPRVEDLDENPHWKYCIDTNTKLLPGFLYELANEFIIGGDYALKQKQISRNIGMLSDDGDSIVDKHSGYVILKIDFITQEEFDDLGFKITSHAIMEKDAGTVVMEKLAAAKQIEDDMLFEDETTQQIYNVFKTVSKNIDIPIVEIREFVMRTTVEIMTKAIKNEESYKKFVAKHEKENTKQKLAPYKTYRNEFIIIIIGCSILIAIQTTTPSFKTKKTFPGCVRSFSGFPLAGGMEDTTGIKYIACVLNKSKSSTEPWNAIDKLNADKITNRMKQVFDAYILKMPELEELYERKRNYMLLHPEETLPEEHSISKWTRFQPPVVETNIIRSLRNVSSDFESEFKKLIVNGNK